MLLPWPRALLFRGRAPLPQVCACAGWATLSLHATLVCAALVTSQPAGHTTVAASDVHFCVVQLVKALLRLRRLLRISHVTVDSPQR
jgi:hypothetical protein